MTRRMLLPAASLAAVALTLSGCGTGGDGGTTTHQVAAATPP